MNMDFHKNFTLIDYMILFNTMKKYFKMNIANLYIYFMNIPSSVIIYFKNSYSVDNFRLIRGFDLIQFLLPYSVEITNQM